MQQTVTSVLGDADDLDLIWGAEAIGSFLKLKNRRQAFRLLETRAIPARKVGKAWVASRKRLRDHILGEDTAADAR